jgi:hypothetical protein
MSPPEKYLDEIDSARLFRVRELSEVKRIFSEERADSFGVQSKAAVVLCYAAWEGFYNECVDAYCRFLKDNNIKIVDAGWRHLIGALEADFNSLRDKNFSDKAKKEFVDKLKDRVDGNFKQFDTKCVSARSNLDFSKIRNNYEILGFSAQILEKHRIRMDQELVGWRHGVAHGNAPSLDTLDLADHVDFATNLLNEVSDKFQAAIFNLSHFDNNLQSS